MEGSTAADTTQLLRAWADGDSGALEQLTPRVYRELRHMAARLLRSERPGYSLQSTDLVHEVYLRLVNAEELEWQHRAHFFAIAATLMRRILLDRARRKAAAKRGGRPQPLDVGKAVDIAQARARELICLDDALDALSTVDPRKARIVELRFFGGLSVRETAEVVRVSPDTVLRDWKIARAWQFPSQTRSPVAVTCPPCIARFSSPFPVRSPARNNRRRRRPPHDFQACRPRRSWAFGSFNSSPKATRVTILPSRAAPSSTSDTCNGTAMEPNSSIPPSMQTFVWAFGHTRDS